MKFGISVSNVGNLGQSVGVQGCIEIGEAADARSDRHRSAGHGLERGQAERLHLTRKQQEVRDAQQGRDALPFSEELHAVAHTAFHRQALGGLAVGPVPDHEEP